MKLAMLVAAITAPLLLGATPSAAATVYPWCLKAAADDDYVIDICYFRTFEQCAQERFNYGTTSFCVQNPQYGLREAQGSKRQRKTKPTTVQ